MSVLVSAGGYDESRKAIHSVHMYVSERDEWLAMPPMKCRRNDAAMAELNGVLYVCGGWNETYEYFDSIECFDSVEWGWIRMEARMQTKRAYHQLVCLGECVYAVGGWDGSNALKSVETLSVYGRAQSSRVLRALPLSIPDMLDAHYDFACLVHRV